MEPFLRNVRANPNIRGIDLPSLPTQKIATYYDNRLFFIYQPRVSLPNLLRAFEDFGVISHLKINLQKSEELNVFLRQRKEDKLSPAFPF